MAQYIRWIGILAVALAAAGCGKKESQTVTPQKMGSEVAVWVDQAGITSAQIQREASRLFSHVPKDMDPERIPAIQARLLNQAVENLVTRQLVRAEMERSGVLISQEELEKGKKDLETALGPGGSLTMLLAEANVPMEEMEMNLRLDLFKNKMTKDQLKAALDAVTEESAKAYYDEHADEFTQPEGRLASHILVRVKADADEAAKTEARAKAEAIRTSLQEGADFEKLAGETSDCMSRSRGGALGVVPRGREAKSFEDAVYGQAIGAIGEVVESPVGFHVIKVTGEQEKTQIPFDDVKVRLVAMLKAQAQQQVAAEYIRSLRDKSTIKLDGPFAAAAAEAEKAAEEQAASDAAAPAVTAPPVSVPAQ